MKLEMREKIINLIEARKSFTLGRGVWTMKELSLCSQNKAITVNFLIVGNRQALSGVVCD
jgi:hypothetical protein